MERNYMKKFPKFIVRIKQEKDDEVIESHHCSSKAQARRKANELIEDLELSGDDKDFYVVIEIIKARY